MLREVAVALVAFAIYIVFTGSATPYDLATGAIVSAALGISTGRLIVVDERKLLQPQRYALALYFFIKYMTLIEFKSHVDVVKRIFNMRLRPGIVKVPLSVSSGYSRLMVALAITNTPGTVVVDEDDEGFYVNWIYVESADPAKAREFISAEFEKYARKIFE
ncbi:MAG: Na+/H+ antiporter subunit E [Desulfurococcaceae archaeon]